MASLTLFHQRKTNSWEQKLERHIGSHKIDLHKTCIHTYLPCPPGIILETQASYICPVAIRTQT